MEYVSESGNTVTGVVWSPGPMAGTVWVLPESGAAASTAVVVHVAKRVQLPEHVVREHTIMGPRDYKGRLKANPSPEEVRDDYRQRFKHAPKMSRKVWTDALGYDPKTEVKQQEALALELDAPQVPADVTPAQPVETTEQDALVFERKRVVRHFQRYSAEQRANLAASHRAGPRQRTAVGEHFYTHPAVRGIAFPTRDRAARAGLKAVQDSRQRAEAGGGYPEAVLASQPTTTIRKPHWRHAGRVVPGSRWLVAETGVTLRRPLPRGNPGAARLAGSRTALARGLAGVARVLVDRRQVRIRVVIARADVVHLVRSGLLAHVAYAAHVAEDPGPLGVPFTWESRAAVAAVPSGHAASIRKVVARGGCPEAAGPPSGTAAIRKPLAGRGNDPEAGGRSSGREHLLGRLGVVPRHGAGGVGLGVRARGRSSGSRTVGVPGGGDGGRLPAAGGVARRAVTIRKPCWRL